MATAEPKAKSSKQTISSLLEDKIRTDIILGNLVPSTKLRMKTLIERYETSSIPLREALSRLTALGFIELIDHQGFSVRKVTEEEIIDITNTRCLIESKALEDSINNADLEWESQLFAVYHMLSNLPLHDLDTNELSTAWEEVHVKFHDALLLNCSSTWLKVLAKQLRDQSSRYRFLSTHYNTTSEVRDVPKEHEEILKAAIARDTPRAIDALCSHYQKTAQSIVDRMRNNNSSENL